MMIENIITIYIFIALLAFAQFVIEPMFDLSTHRTNKYKVKVARGVFISLFWPIALVGVILYGIWKLFYYAFFYREKSY